MQRFGEKLHTLREAHNLSVRQLSTDLGIKSTGYVISLEKGRRYPSIPLLVKISLYFNVTTDRLVRDDLELD